MLELIRRAQVGKRYIRAEGAIERFSARVLSVLKSEEREKFPLDFILSAGNSGLVCDEVSVMVMSSMGVSSPELVRVPVSRKAGEKIAIPPDVGELGAECLFVDDEIRTGSSLFLALKSIKPHLPRKVTVSIVAENMFFEWTRRENWVRPLMYSYSEHRGGGTNKMSHILKDKEFSELSRHSPVHAEKKQILALLLSGMVKEKRDGVFVFTRDVVDHISARSSHFSEIKEEVSDRVKRLAVSGIAKYMNGDIKFRDV